MHFRHVTGRSPKEVDRLVAENGMTMLPPSTMPTSSPGREPLALKSLNSFPKPTLFWCPCPVAGFWPVWPFAAKSINPAIRVVGISMERGCAMITSLQEGKPTAVKELPTLADSLGGGIGQNNQYTFDMCADLTDDFVLVNETQIADGIAPPITMTSRSSKGQLPLASRPFAPD